MTRRVVITGMGGVTAFGENWQSVSSRLLAYENAVRKMPEWQIYDGLHTLLGAPIDDFTLPEHYTRKRIRAMGRVSLMSTRATELALEQAGLPAQVLRTPRALQEQGCGYCVRAPAEPETIRQLLTAERIAFRRLYRRGADGAWQEAEP